MVLPLGVKLPLWIVELAIKPVREAVEISLQEQVVSWHPVAFEIDIQKLRVERKLLKV